MTVRMDPAATHGVVIGIERYDVADTWGLPGAARDAVRVTGWLRAAGVPAEQVALFLDVLPGDPDGTLAAASGLGVTPRASARRDDIMAYFTDELRQQRAARDTLVVYWSGHGVLDDQRRRTLFTSDAGPNDRRNIRVEDLLDYLIDREVSGFHQQIVLVDACANFVESRNYRTHLTQTTFPVSGVRRAGVRQFVIYSAAQGTAAANRRTARAGAFTDTLLGWLHGDGQPARWPPDMPALSAFVGRHVRQLADSGQTQLSPVYLSRTVDWSGSADEREFGGLPVTGSALHAAAGATRTPSQLRRLAAALAGCTALADPARQARLLGPADDPQEAVAAVLARGGMTTLLASLDELCTTEEQRLDAAKVRRLWQVQGRVAPLLAPFAAVTAGQLRHYYDVVPDRRLAPSHHDLDQVLEYLADLGGAAADAPLPRFVARLEQLTGRRVPDEWFELPVPALHALRDRERAAIDRSGRSHLVIDLQPPGSGSTDPQAGWPAAIVGHLRTGDGAWTRETVACPGGLTAVQQAVNRLINWAYEQQPDGTDMTLGFLAPRARFDDVPESWAFSDSLTASVPIREEYPVMLHFRERLEASRACAYWRRRATAIAEEITHAAPKVSWLEPPRGGGVRRISTSVEAERPACVGFRFAPGPFRGDLRNDPLVAAVNAGAPYLMWLDAEPGDWDEVTSVLAALVQRGDFDDVPLRLKELRDTAGDTAADATTVRLVWDNQDWLPDAGRLTGLAVREAAQR
ncbi:caspase family protein [Dactylosporangium siamense]|uniref:Peptidase C14 caspase domain-containing protein n=1 Tax=Dactylosporangium siamense TaxID=685454 RepID=A0A919PTI6_9ACTN|nr:caspase family protein [Dactylosporangium siamense]GIG49919.1 hypothetical protein Dsi01nite_079600 [Dactylosporangium siamense]